MNDSTRPERVVKRAGQTRTAKRQGALGANPSRNLHTAYQRAAVLALVDVADALPVSFTDLAHKATRRLEVDGTVAPQNVFQLVGAAGVKADAEHGQLISIDEGSLATAKARYGVQEVPAS